MYDVYVSGVLHGSFTTQIAAAQLHNYLATIGISADVTHRPMPTYTKSGKKV